jgi:hypothetical protein
VRVLYTPRAADGPNPFRRCRSGHGYRLVTPAAPGEGQ